LKKLYKEDSIGLKPEKILCNLLFLFFFTASISFSQIHINGFCRLNNYKTFPNYSHIYITDFNKDSFPDVILFNGENNNVVTLASAGDESFNEPKNKFFFFPITAINYFGKKNKNELIHIFVSRKERLAGLVSFSKYGTLKLLNIIRFSTFPSKVITADLNNDGKNEALIFGKTFAGLALINEDNFILHDTLIVSTGTYSDAAFINLDYDNFTDIAAIDMLHNSIDFFYNNGNNNFVNERQIEFPTQISNLEAVDFNNDSYSDLIFVAGNSFQILLGDSVSSFSNKLIIKTEDKIFKYVVGDFNSDKIMDLAYIGNLKNNIKILFGINDSTFTKPILLFKKDTLNALMYYQHNKTTGLLSLAADGTLSRFTNNLALPDSFRLAFAANPVKLMWKNYPESGRFELSFIDKYELSFKKISGDKNSFNNLFEIPISKLFSNIKTLYTDKNKESTIFFNKGEQLIEFLQTEADSFKLKQIYTNYPILDAAPIYERGEEKPSIITVTTGNNAAGITSFKFNNSHLVKQKFDSLDTNLINAELFINNNREVFYWKKSSDTLLYIRNNLDNGNRSIIYKTIIRTDSVGNVLTNVKLFENRSFSGATPISIIQQNDNFKILIIEKRKIRIVKLAKESLGNKIKNIEYVKYVYDKKLKQKSFFILANDSTAIFKIDVDKNFMLQSLSKYIESEKVYDYFVTRLFDIYNYIVYTSESDNSIKFLRIK